MCADYMDLLRQIDSPSLDDGLVEVDCLQTWNIRDLLAMKIDLMEYPDGPKNHRWTVIARAGEFVNLVRQTTKQSWLRGRWMAPVDVTEPQRIARTVLVKTKPDGTKVWLPLTHEPPRTIPVTELLEEAFAEHRPEDDLPPSKCAELRSAIAATPSSYDWNTIKGRWGLLDDIRGCPGCRACAEA